MPSATRQPRPAVRRATVVCDVHFSRTWVLFTTLLPESTLLVRIVTKINQTADNLDVPPAQFGPQRVRLCQQISGAKWVRVAARLARSSGLDFGEHALIEAAGRKFGKMSKFGEIVFEDSGPVEVWAGWFVG